MFARILVPPDSVAHLSKLHNSVKECSYTASYSTLAMFPEPEVRAGLYSVSSGGFYDEIPKTSWRTVNHENGSATYSFSDITFQVSDLTASELRDPSVPSAHSKPFMRGFCVWSLDCSKPC